MPDNSDVPNVPALWEWRLREVEKRLDSMTTLQQSLATKDDLKRLESSLASMALEQHSKEDRTFDMRKALFAPLVVSAVVSVANWFITQAHTVAK